MYEKIYSILEEFLGKSKQGGYEKDVFQYQFPCPRCIDEYGEGEEQKYNLEVNLQKNVFQCWKCASLDDTMKGNIAKLIKKYGGGEHYRQYKEVISDYKKSRLYDIGLFDQTDGVQLSFEQDVKLPKTYRSINLSTCKDKKLVEYLTKRRIDQKIIDTFKIGYTTKDESDYTIANRIIIPSYDSFGDLNYFVGRDFLGSDKRIKYKNCDANKKEIIFQEGLINFDSNLILVEGAIDCIYGPVGRTISLLGKSLSKDSHLYQALHAKCNGTITICLDNDTDINETKRIYNLLNFGRLYGKIYYIRLNKYKDFGELYENFGKEGIIEALRHAKQFNTIDLIV